MADLSISGLASGFDWKSVVDQLTQISRAPQQRLRSEQNKILQRNNSYSSIQTQLSVLSSRVKTLKEASLFGTRQTSVGDATIASASATTDTALGTYDFNFTQLATAAVQRGTANAGASLNATNDVSGLTLSTAAFASPVTAGKFTVNNQQIIIETADTLQGVFDKISTATGGAVTGAYDSATDKVTLTGSSPVVLGSATDTSNFLTAAQLYNNGTATVASRNTLGVVKQSGLLNSANLSTTISDGGAGAGEFKINGVSLSFNAGSDSVADVLKRINDSTAGVTAAYDSVNDRFSLTNKITGDVGVAIEDVTGNFLAATGLSGGTLDRGKDLLYTINGGGQLVSHSNTVTADSSGITGLTVTALKEATTKVTVGTDTTTIKSAINSFISEYNRAQSLIDAQTASTTDAKGTVTAGTLAGESDAFSLAASLRGQVNAQGNSSGVIKFLDDLGIASNGTDNTLRLADSTKLDRALANNLTAVKDFFTNPTTGLAAKLDTYIDKVSGDDGFLKTKQANLTKQSAAIDTQVSDMERLVLSSKDRLTASFVAMETAQSQINQQLQFLQKRFG